MTCEQVLDALLDGASDPGGERINAKLGNHADGCTKCAALWEAERLLRASSTTLPALTLPPTLQQALRGLRPASRLTPFLRRWLPWSLCALALVLTVQLAPRADLWTSSAWRLGLPLALALSGFAGLLALFRYRGAAGLGVPSAWRWLAVLSALTLFQLLTVAQGENTSHLPLLAPPRDCLLLGLLAGGTLTMALVWLARHSILTGAASAGALAGCSAGYVAWALLHLHCPSQLALHLQVAHGLPLLLSIVAGALWGRRWLAA